MKTSFFALLFLAVGCSAPKSGKVTVMPRPAAVVSQDLTERVRYPEIVMDYHVARYVDPNHPMLLHESHTVYRVEGQATWNLHSPSGCFVLPSGAGALPNPAFAPPQVNDAVIAELNQQRTITRGVAQQAESLNGSLREFATAISNTRNLVEQNRTLREQLTRTERRLDALEAGLNKRPTEQQPEDKGNNN
jgi:hypothetical protein